MSAEVILAVATAVGIPVLAWITNQAKNQLRDFIAIQIKGVELEQASIKVEQGKTNEHLATLNSKVATAMKDNADQDKMIYWVLGQMNKTPRDFDEPA